MWRVTAVQIALLITTTLSTALHLPPVTGDTRTQGSAQIKEARGVRHGYRYQVQFPTSQNREFTLDQYRSVPKYEENSSQGNLANEKYIKGYENNRLMDQKSTLQQIEIQNTMRSDNLSRYQSSVSSPEPKVNYSKSGFNPATSLPRSGQSIISSHTQNFVKQPVSLPEMYLPPQQTENSIHSGTQNFVGKPVNTPEMYLPPQQTENSIHSGTQSFVGKPVNTPEMYLPPQQTGINTQSSSPNFVGQPVRTPEMYLPPQQTESSIQSTSQDFDGQPIVPQEMYMPPQKTEITASKGSDGYHYEKPSNQFILPTENNNQEYVMGYPMPPAPSNGNGDDSVEIVPPPDSKRSSWSGDGSRVHPNNPKPEEQVHAEVANNHIFRNPPTSQVGTDLKSNQENQYNLFSPPEQSHEQSPRNLNIPSENFVARSDNADEIVPEASQPESSRVATSALSYAQIKSPDPKTEVDDLTDTSLMVHFAGSVFHTDGLPHPGTDLVFPVEYVFSYDLRGWPRLGHEESRAHHTTHGRYWVTLPDGRLQVVEYTAGPQGFVPTVTYQEPTNRL